ncbi:MAG TPA: polysaccharide deacetylase family protein [Candidatus Competibacteraceae bacterium]|nr:polysaccharide deacetylase family protein [Candidatus Competibacteraceae bacterium]
MSTWDGLRRELDAWGESDRCATLWWRDDDAQAPSPALGRLLALHRDFAVPLALAVIPAALDPALTLSLDPDCSVLQHGYAHTNHASSGEKKCELGAHRPLETVLAELMAGRRILERGFPERWLPVLVPPWNRLAAELPARLPGIGLHGLSSHTPRRAREPFPGLIQANTHVDPVDWRGQGGFVGTEAALAQAVLHLRRRRLGEVDGAEPTGLLSHHLVHDAATWAFLERFLAVTTAHPATCWLAPAQVFA